MIVLGAFFIGGNKANFNKWEIDNFKMYTSKADVHKAVKMRKEGFQIVIVHENDFWDEIY